MPIQDIEFTSPLLPGGSLVRAVFDRVLMQVSDRGGASGLIGARWADLCDEAMKARVGQSIMTGFASVPQFAIERIVRLDDIPAIAAAASSRKLQNPDFLVIGRYDDQAVIQAADAKFSVETARAKQVSREVVVALTQLGPLMTRLLDIDVGAALVVPGLFVCPDFSLTHLMLQRRAGILRTTVSRSEVLLLPITPTVFGAGLDGAALMTLLHQIDRLAVSPSASLLALLYYFRTARACVCCWLDETGPLLTYKDPRIVDESAVVSACADLARVSSSAFDLVLRWNARATLVQEQRTAVERATSLSISGKELRAMTLATTGGDETRAPSVNRVRRQLASWQRSELRAVFGPLTPPVPNLTDMLRELAAATRALEPRLRAEAQRVIDDSRASRSA